MLQLLSRTYRMPILQYCNAKCTVACTGETCCPCATCARNTCRCSGTSGARRARCELADNILTNHDEVESGSELQSSKAMRAKLCKTFRFHRTCAQALEEKYGVIANQLRMWVHYQPSYYHFHVHIAHTKWDGAGLQCGKAILLDDVIGERQRQMRGS